MNSQAVRPLIRLGVPALVSAFALAFAAGCGAAPADTSEERETTASVEGEPAADLPRPDDEVEPGAGDDVAARSTPEETAATQTKKGLAGATTSKTAVGASAVPAGQTPSAPSLAAEPQPSPWEGSAISPASLPNLPSVSGW